MGTCRILWQRAAQHAIILARIDTSRLSENPVGRVAYPPYLAAGKKPALHYWVIFALSDKLLDVLTYQINEILNADPISEVNACDIPCIFGMSRLDPLLSFKMTKESILGKFKDVWVESYDLSYHQPPEPFTFDGLNQEFGGLLEKFATVLKGAPRKSPLQALS